MKEEEPVVPVNVITWKWNPITEYRSTFTCQHVNTLKNMVKRNSSLPINFICVTDDGKGLDSDITHIPIWKNPVPAYGALTKPNCFVRLRAFSEEIKSIFGDKFIWFDLDAVVVSNIDSILKDKADFKIWKVDNEFMPCNGSLVSMKAGARKDIWEKFDAEKVHPRYGFSNATRKLVGSDQAWIAQHLDGNTQYFGQKDGIISYRCHMQKRQDWIPRGAKIIFFHGNEKPWDSDLQDLPWIKTHYQ